MDNKPDIKYFLFSSAYNKEHNEVENKVGREFVTGSVNDGALRKEFSVLSDTPTIPRYSDAKIIYKGDINNTTFTKPSVKPKR